MYDMTVGTKHLAYVSVYDTNSYWSAVIGNKIVVVMNVFFISGQHFFWHVIIFYIHYY